VPDPYDTYSPHHDWGPFELSAGQLSALGLGSPPESVQIQRDDSWRVTSVRFRLESGAVVSRSGARIAQALHLRSTWFSIGELQLETSSARVLYGRPLNVEARAANVKGALLQERSGTGVWRTLRHLDHPAQLSFEPRANTAFRVALPGTSGTSVAVAVEPRLQVRALGPRLLGGEVLPRPDGPVNIWRLEHGIWRVVAHPVLDSHGVFRTPLPLRPVAYKITVAADGRLAAAERWLHVTRRLLATLRQ
jgi:hypothetical protein